MPKDRNKTYSDHQAQAARQKKHPKKKAQGKDVNQAAPRMVREAATKAQ